MNSHHPYHFAHRTRQTVKTPVAPRNNRRRFALSFSTQRLPSILLLCFLVFAGARVIAAQTSPAAGAASAEKVLATARDKETQPNLSVAKAPDHAAAGGSSFIKRAVRGVWRFTKSLFSAFGEENNSIRKVETKSKDQGEVMIKSAATVNAPGFDHPEASVKVLVNETKNTDDGQPITVAPEKIAPGVFRKPTNVVKPAYPPLAAAKDINGKVLVDIQIDSGGMVRKASAVSGPFLLHQAALEAALRWRFEPVRIDLGQHSVRLAFIFRPLSYVRASGESDYAAPYQMAVTWSAASKDLASSCQYWQSKVDSKVRSPFPGQSVDETEPGNILKGIECLLQMEGNKHLARFSGVTRVDVSQIFEPAQADVAALFYISYLYTQKWEHANAIALQGEDGDINAPQDIAIAYQSYRRWFEQVKAVGIEKAREMSLQPLKDTNIEWY